MRSRGLVVVLALILATLATAGVFLYSRGVKQNAETGGSQTTVVVSKTDIPANTNLNSLIDDGQFVEAQVPTDDLVEGAITEVSQLRNRRSSVFILAGEQIPIARVQGGKVAGGVLSIPDGYQAVTLSLDGPAAIGAALSGGDNVTVLATFDGVFVPKKGQQATPVTAPGAQQRAQAVTVVLVPQVQVLRVNVPQDANTSAQSSTPHDVGVTLALLPGDAQKLVFGLEQGQVYLSLLPPGGRGVQLDPLTVDGIISPPKANKGK
jgi:Flp pilus assembly protein CpaB